MSTSEVRAKELALVRLAFRAQRVVVSSTEHGPDRKREIDRACALLERERKLTGGKYEPSGDALALDVILDLRARGLLDEKGEAA